MAGASCARLIDLLRAPVPDLDRIIATFVACYNKSYGTSASISWDISLEDWERYEFLGDRVLSLIVAQALFSHRLQAFSEGEMTQNMEGIVSNSAIDRLVKCRAAATFSLLIPSVIAIQNTYGERITGGAFEALIGALYCEFGLDEVAGLVNAIMGDRIRDCRPDENPIGALQEYFQKKTSQVPEYRETDRTGPDHRRMYTCEVLFGGEVLGKGHGRTLQHARKAAARLALEHIRKE